MKTVPSDGVKDIRPVGKQACLASYLETDETSLTPEVCEVWSAASASRSSAIDDDKLRKYRHFQLPWLQRDELKDWLIYDSSTDIVKCSVCSTWKSNYGSKFVTGFSKPFKLETLKIHAKSHKHMNSLRNLSLLKSEMTP